MKIIYTKEEMSALQDMKDEIMTHVDEEERQYMNKLVIEDMEMSDKAEVKILPDGSVEYTADEEFSLKALRAYTNILHRALPIFKKIYKAVEPLLELINDDILNEMCTLFDYFQEQVSEVLED